MDNETAVIATTNKLPNGHKFSREDLESIAEVYRARLAADPYLNFNHRYDRPPVAKVTEVWVGVHPADEAESALYIRYEMLEDADPDEIAHQFRTGAFSISFFGSGVSNTEENQPEDLTIGISPELGAGEEELAEILRDALHAFPRTRVSVRQFHQHAAEPATAVIVVFGMWLIEQAGGKIVERLWSILFEKKDTPVRNANLLNAHIRTRHGEVNIQIPMVPETLEIQKALADGIRSALAQNAGEEQPGRVAVTYDEEMRPTKHVLPMGGTNSLPGSQAAPQEE